MSYQDHLKTCSYCSKNKDSQPQTRKVTVSVKSASSYYKQKKLSELAAIIKGTSYAGLENSSQPKGASANYSKVNGPLEKKLKLKELGKMIRN